MSPNLLIPIPNSSATNLLADSSFLIPQVQTDPRKSDKPTYLAAKIHDHLGTNIGTGLEAVSGSAGTLSVNSLLPQPLIITTTTQKASKSKMTKRRNTAEAMDFALAQEDYELLDLATGLKAGIRGWSNVKLRSGL